MVDPLMPSFERISLENELFKSILSIAKADALELFGWEFGKRHFAKAKVLFEASGEKLTFFRYVNDILAAYGRWFRVEGNASENSTIITLHHALGRRWSFFLRGYLSAANEEESRKLVIEISDEILRLRFSDRER